MRSQHSLLLLLLSLWGVILSSLYAKQERPQQIEVLAEAIEGNQTVVHAKGGVVVYYNDAIIHAKSASYDRKRSILILDGQVEMIGYEGTKEHSDHIEIDTKHNAIAFHNLFMATHNDIWILSEEGNKQEGNYTFGASMLSSCEVEDPLWSVRFDHAKYDEAKRYMRLYDATLYFKEIPLFYTPYWAFNLQRERSSGLLFPFFGYSQDEGLIYEQPLFWAISPSMDLEFNPQIRTERSVGIYATYRFADSPYSKGSVRVGYFKDFDDYVEKEGLDASKHYGFELLYDRSKLFSDKWEGYEDGLYANVTLLNDIDYLNLQKNTLTHFGQVPLQESRINYFLASDKWYGGINAKYFIDTRLSSNDTTIQTLPMVQLHRYSDHLLFQSLTYSADLQYKHLDRREGSRLNQVELRLPIEFNYTFFDDLLDVSVGETLYFGSFYFSNGDLTYDHLNYRSALHSLTLSSNLIKAYSNTIHVIEPTLHYIQPGEEKVSPVSFATLQASEPEVTELFSVGLPEEAYTFTLNQYFYNKSMKLFFSHRLAQSYYPDRENTLSSLDNEMTYYWKRWRFYNEIEYSHTDHAISASSSSVHYSQPGFSWRLGHTYKQRFNENGQGVTTANAFSLNLAYDVNEHFKTTGALSYDLEKKGSRLWKVGLFYQEDCWSVDAQLQADVLPRPINAAGEREYTQEYGFSVHFNFIPFVSVGMGSLE